MKIHNLRLGHATNSSSSHSIVIAPANYTNMPSNDDCNGWGDFNYGWEEFILTNPDSKTDYLAAQLFNSMTGRNGLSDDIAMATIRDWLNVDLAGSEPGIDHQSALALGSTIITEKFIKDMAEFFQNDRVIVYGGNDNSDGMDIPEEFESIGFLQNITDSGYGLRLKNDGNFWIFYNQATGSKIRFSFDVDDMDAEQYVKATSPELVDVKITDFCPYGCSFCYQSSTKDGVHADYKEIGSLLYELSAMDVFEVAIGGGEPTMHPQFSKILSTCTKMNIKPNFTTYSKVWLTNAEIIKAVQENVGGIGVSLHTEKDLKLMGDVAEAVNGYRDNFGGYWRGNTVNIMGQHVLGTHSLAETVQLIAEAWKLQLPVLLLGYKDTGFGSSFKPHDMTGIELALKLLLEKPENYQRVTLSVDTAVLERHPKLCKVLEVPEILTTSPEGAFSMYIDAVKRRMAKSSYVAEEDYVPLEDAYGRVFADSIIEEFSRW